jgi:LacI family transcriptional regulator
MATMRDVALRAGVSAKTVSRVINRDRYVSDDVRKRVEHAVEELSYVPNMLAVTFRNGKDAAIGVSVPGVADPFFGGIVEAVEREASERGVATIVTAVGFGPEHEQRSLEAVLQRQVIGMIICPVGPDLSYLRSWQERTPMVFVDRPPPRLTADAVVQDDRGGAHEGVRHLRWHGHTRIAFLGDGDRVPTTMLRFKGYRDAVLAGGLAFDESLVYMGEIDTESMRTVLRRMFAGPHPPTALFSSNARCTIALVPALQALGRRDVALVGFGDFALAASLRPAVTVVDQDSEVMGVFAARRLFERIDEPDRRRRRRTVLPVRLVTRTSCGMANQEWPSGHGEVDAVVDARAGGEVDAEVDAEVDPARSGGRK